SGGDQPIVVICTTESNIDHISDALHAGSDEYVVKPFNRDAVVARFQDIRDSKISD
ncbi:chemotaxis protein CheY, partial [Sphingomonas sanguinis]